MSVNHRNVAGNEDLIKRLFNKVYSAILSEKIFCPPETAVYLAAYACQAKFGSAQSLRNPVPPVKDLLPKSTLDNHNLSTNEWETRISNWHLKLMGISFLDAIVEYLDIAQDVELYGASIFEVESRSQDRKWISLDAVGLNIYDSKKKPPTRRYVWSDIATFTAWEDKIEVVLAHEPKKVIEFVTRNPQVSSLLESLFNGGKELYSRRKRGGSSKYILRSESNSSMRMRPHQMTAMEMSKLKQQITELELELPRQATDYEYASWQVKDQLRQARGMEAKLLLNVPSTDETRRLQYRVAQIRVFLEQDIFKEKEPTDRPHRYRGNFAIRIGGSPTTRLEGYSSDVDSESEINTGWKSAVEPPLDDSHAKPAEAQMPPQPLHQTSVDHKTRSISVISSSSETEGHGYVDHPFPSDNKERLVMPALPQTILPDHPFQPKTTKSDTPNKWATYNPEVLPKLPDRPMYSLASDDLSLTATGSIRSGPGYPEARGSEELDPPGSVTSPNLWKHIIRTPEQDLSNQFSKGRIHGQVIESDNVQFAYRPPVQPKPKVSPRATMDPRIVTPDYYGDVEGSGGPGQYPQFPSLKVIQSGHAKKRIDLFEAL